MLMQLSDWSSYEGLQLWGPLCLPLVFAVWFKLTSSANGLLTNRDIFMHIWQWSHSEQPGSQALLFRT